MVEEKWLLQPPKHETRPLITQEKELPIQYEVITWGNQ